MKTLYFFLFILASGISLAQDSTVVYKQFVDGTIQSIYIDKSGRSSFYESISNFDFQYFDKESYDYSMNFLHEQHLHLTKSLPIIPWTQWITLKLYKGEFYVYHPCDFLFHFQQSINDSTWIDWTGEGPVANKIDNQRKIDSSTYVIELKGIYDRNRKIIIHIIDIEKGIAVFEQILSSSEKNYYMMIAADKIQNLPIIVNECPKQKQRELQFDIPDYSVLLDAK